MITIDSYRRMLYFDLRFDMDTYGLHCVMSGNDRVARMIGIEY